MSASSIGFLDAIAYLLSIVRDGGGGIGVERVMEEKEQLEVERALERKRTSRQHGPTPR